MSTTLVSISPTPPPRPAWLRAPAPVGQNYRELKQLDRRPRPAHGLRKRGLPQRRRMLEPSHRHVHDPGQRVYAPLRFLRRAERRAARSRLRRAAPRGRSRRRHGPALRRDHQREPRRPRRWRRRTVRPHHPRHSRTHPRLRRRSAGARFPGQPRRHGHRDGRRARRAQPQHRNRTAPLPPGAPGRALRALARHAGLRQKRLACKRRSSPA